MFRYQYYTIGTFILSIVCQLKYVLSKTLKVVIFAGHFIT